MRRAKVEFDQCNLIVDRVWAPITARLERYPGRNLRPEHVHSFLREWQAMPGYFRLHIGVTRPKPARAEIFEIRLSPTTLWNDDWPNEDGEMNLAIVNTIVALGRDGQRYATPIAYVASHIVSRHALARRYQRGSEWDDAAVLRDISALMQVQPDKALDGQPCDIPTQGGEWRGAHLVMADRARPAPIVALRTWLANDQLIRRADRFSASHAECRH